MTDYYIYNLRKPLLLKSKFSIAQVHDRQIISSVLQLMIFVWNTIICVIQYKLKYEKGVAFHTVCVIWLQLQAHYFCSEIVAF